MKTCVSLCFLQALWNTRPAHRAENRCKNHCLTAPECLETRDQKITSSERHLGDKKSKKSSARRATKAWAGGQDSHIWQIACHAMPCHAKPCQARGPSSAVLGLTWGRLGPPWAVLGLCWAALGRLGSSRSHLGLIRRRLGSTDNRNPKIDDSFTFFIVLNSKTFKK